MSSESPPTRDGVLKKESSTSATISAADRRILGRSHPSASANYLLQVHNIKWGTESMKAFVLNYCMGKCLCWYIMTDWPPVSDLESI